MRTYRIVPLHPIAGIIEWVDNAIPLGNWLTPHHEANTRQMHLNECRRLMNELLEQKASTKEKLRVFTQEILPNYKPCLRNFFIEAFPSIDQWYRAIILYAKSLANSSIVGYLVGLGDRHPQNILLDRLTGELIHIDLNLIFEQGRLLRVPELVPFRMTQELIDGLGALPFDGEPFLPTAEATWDLLKENSEKILTIPQVFKHDPLHRWTVGQAKLQKLSPNPMLFSQQPAAETHSKDEAERVLTRIKEKLAGIEEGCPLSTAGHINFLLRIATDNEILCQMHPGWQPWN